MNLRNGYSAPDATGMNVIIEVRAIGMSTSQGIAVPLATPPHTGRPVLFDPNYGIVRDCAFLEAQDEMHRHPLWSELRDRLGVAPVASGVAVPCFRFIYFEGDPPSSKGMGPPNRAQCRGGRYNNAGRPVLYLCDSEFGVRGEVEPQDGLLYVQRYLLPTNQLRLADFRV